MVASAGLEGDVSETVGVASLDGAVVGLGWTGTVGCVGIGMGVARKVGLGIVDEDRLCSNVGA